MRHNMFTIEGGGWRNDGCEAFFVGRQVFINEQKIAESDAWDDVDENGSHMFVFSKKRDVVGTCRIEPDGKITTRAVSGTADRAWVQRY